MKGGMWRKGGAGAGAGQWAQQWQQMQQQWAQWQGDGKGGQEWPQQEQQQQSWEQSAPSTASTQVEPWQEVQGGNQGKGAQVVVPNKGKAGGKGAKAGKAQWEAPPPAEDPPEIVLYVVCMSDDADTGMNTLIGKYSEEGVNHGRKYYKKAEGGAMSEEQEVYIYYWDERDGADSNGWWFGNMVGGSQVWSRAQQGSPKPPPTGWTIPWDGEVNPDLQVLDRVAKKSFDLKAAEAQRKKDEEKQKLAQLSQWQDRLKQAKESCGEIEAAVENIMESVKGMAPESGLEEITANGEQLSQQMTILQTLQKSIQQLGMETRTAPNNVKMELATVLKQARQLSNTVSTEKQKMVGLRAAKVKEQQEAAKKAAEDEKWKALEGEHNEQLQEMMVECTRVTDEAEDEVEKVAIAAAPLEIEASDDLEGIMNDAINETEERCGGAETAVTEARKVIASKLSAAMKFGPVVKKTAVEEFGALQEKLKEMQKKLDQFKNIRKDYELKNQTKALLEELNTKIAQVEIEVEQAAGCSMDSVEEVKECEAAVNQAQPGVMKLRGLLSSHLKEKDKGEAFLEELAGLQERAQSASDKLMAVMQSVKEARIRIAAADLLQTVSEKVRGVEEVIQQMNQLASTSLPGPDDVVEDAPEPEEGEEGETGPGAVFKEAEEMVTRVQGALVEAQTFLARKVSDANKLSDSSKSEAKQHIVDEQKKVSEFRKELEEFKTKVAFSRCAKVLREVQTSANEAVEHVQKLQQEAENLGEAASPGEPASDTLKEGVKNLKDLEKTAVAGVAALRKNVQAKALDIKKLAGSNPALGQELTKLQGKGSELQKNIAEVVGKIKAVEEKIRVKELLAEIMKWSTGAEEEVEKAQMAAVPLDDDEPDDETAKKQQEATEAAKTKLAHTSKLIALKLKNARDKASREELEALKDRVAKSEAKLAAIADAAKEQEQRLKAQDNVKAAAERVDKVEAEVQKVGEADEVFLKGEDMAAHELAAALLASEAAIAGADAAVAEAENFISVSLADAKEFCEEARDLCDQDLQAASARLESILERLKELKNETNERKKGAQAALSQAKVESVQKAIEKLDALVKSWDTADKGDDADGQSAEEVVKVETEAQNLMADARKFVTDGLSEARSFTGDERRARTSLLSKMQSSLTQSQVTLGKLSRIVSNRGATLKSKKVAAEATDFLEQIKAEFESCTKVAGALLDGDRADLVLSMHIQSLVEALRKHVASSGSSTEALFEKFSTQDASGDGPASASVAQFSAFVEALPELTGNESLLFSQELASKMLCKIAGEDVADRGLGLAEFQALFPVRYVCKERTAVLAAPGPAEVAADGPPGLAAPVTMLEVDEIVKVLKQEVKEEATYAQCVLGRDDSTCWVLLTSSDGKAILKPCESTAWQLESIEAFINAVLDRCTKIVAALDKELQAVKSEKEGPLAALKTTLLQLKTKASAEHGKVEQLKKKVTATKSAVAKTLQVEQKAVHEARVQALAMKKVKDVEMVVEAAESKVSKVVEAVKSRNADTLQKDLGAGELEDIKFSADDALKAVINAKTIGNNAVKAQSSSNGADRSAQLEVRVSITKLLSRLSSAERRCKICIEPVRAAFDRVVGHLVEKALTSFRAAVRRLGKDFGEFFEECAGGQGELSSEQFTSLVEHLPNHGLNKDDIALLFRTLSAEKLTKQVFVSTIQEFFMCEKGTTITSSFNVAEADSILRKLEPGEYVEIVEGPQEHEETQVMRARGRALRDGTQGWVTIKGNKGTSYLKPVSKPRMKCSAPIALLGSLEDKASVLRNLEPDEVLELLQGPIDKTSPGELTLRGTASKDSTTGWITLRDAAGVEFATAAAGLFKCKGNIAMTDNIDVRQCKVVRKIEIGETLTLAEEKEEKEEKDEEEGESKPADVSRRRFKAMKDGAEGWVTTKGTQGTLFLEEVKSNYIVQRPVALRASAAKTGKAVRELEVGEAFQAAGPPREERPERSMAVHVRSEKDGSTGWALYPLTKSAPLTMIKPA